MPRVPPVTIATRPAIVSSQVVRAQETNTRPGASLISIRCRRRAPLAFHAHSNAHAAADAQRREALLGAALLHLEQQGREHAGARSADRMAERDRAAVDVDLA